MGLPLGPLSWFDSLGLCGRLLLVPLQVNNNCATGSTAMYMAKQFVEGGISDCVMALGA